MAEKLHLDGLNATDLIAETLGKMKEQGFEFPVYLLCTAMGGTVLVASYDFTEDGEVKEGMLCNHESEPGRATPPLQLIFIDRRGRSKIMLLQRGEPIH